MLFTQEIERFLHHAQHQDYLPCSLLLHGHAEIISTVPALMYKYVEMADETLLRMLLQYGLDVNVQDFGGRTLLSFACKLGDSSLIAFLLEQGADASIVQDSGETPLMVAAARGNLSCIKLLLEHNADLNYRSGDGRTALSEAIDNFQTEAVHFLLGNGVLRA
ncbi:ankyrin repeat domain-containing protein [Saccharibacillus endophyticus]|uniref:Ankyrin repeat domain-containing protein n=1 Tax=Saccharibacillus endophyticus TaxID=2060666 RepID=A0ABQ1ZXR1_9BACL|nr:ankyrin repeat domain-containing protein [Saccharibacillus endophyticus]GGH80198.1 hypothetical protein GCM10007362_28140 [Saccharibacillus endophyticus]